MIPSLFCEPDKCGDFCSFKFFNILTLSVYVEVNDFLIVAEKLFENSAIDDSSEFLIEDGDSLIA